MAEVMGQAEIDALVAEQLAPPDPEKQTEYIEILLQNFKCRYCDYSMTYEQDEKRIIINMFLPPSVSFKGVCNSDLGHALYPTEKIRKIKRTKK